MQEEYRNTGSNKQCSLDPLYTGSPGGTFYCISKHILLHGFQLLRLHLLTHPRSPAFLLRAVACHQQTSPKINHKWIFIQGRERELWVLPIRANFRDQSPGKMTCWGKREEEQTVTSSYVKLQGRSNHTWEERCSAPTSAQSPCESPSPFVKGGLPFLFSFTDFPLHLVGAHSGGRRGAGLYIYPSNCYFIPFWSHLSFFLIFPLRQSSLGSCARSVSLLTLSGALAISLLSCCGKREGTLRSR